MGRLLLIPIALFTALAVVQLALQQPNSDLTALIATLLVIITTMAGAYVILARAAANADSILAPVVFCLSALGLVMVQRLAPALFWKQALWLVLGVAAMLAVAVFPRSLRWLQRYRYSWLAVGLLLLTASLVFGVNPLGRGARLWLGLGVAYVQPAEFLKLVLIVFLASYLAEKQELIRLSTTRVAGVRIPALPYVAPLIVAWGLALLLLTAQQDLGAGTLLFGTALAMLYIASRQLGFIEAGAVLLILALLAGYNVSRFVALRIDVWLHPWSVAETGGYQIVQSLMTFASGGLLGTGLGRGFGAQYIPVVHTDFVFAAIGEELGLAGAAAVLLLYCLLLQRGLRIAMSADSPFERFLAAGLSIGIALQAWVIAAGNLKVMPLTGVTLPFISYGGSSLLASFLSVGLLLHISAARGATGTRDDGQAFDVRDREQMVVP